MEVCLNAGFTVGTILFLFGKNTLPKSIDFDGVVHRRDKNVSSI